MIVVVGGYCRFSGPRRYRWGKVVARSRIQGWWFVPPPTIFKKIESAYFAFIRNFRLPVIRRSTPRPKGNHNVRRRN